ncbi:MAG: hypothetical protein KAR05_07495 [Candidatus Omnitrophica bacterium]|nr:hypothetical protein [Candidatus Omnitrophota bacterium]
MARYYFRVNFLTIMIILFTASLGYSATYNINQDVLKNSKIKKKSLKKQIFRRIIKTLPKEVKKCPIVVTDIAFRQRKSEYNSVAEEWTVDICQEAKVYFIIDESPYGGYYTVEPKEARKAREKNFGIQITNLEEIFGRILFSI